MRKASAATLAVVIVVALVALLAPAAGATTPTSVSGVWSWHGGEGFNTDPLGGDMYIYGYELGNWTGSFQGNSYEPYTGVIRALGTLDQSVWAIITVNFQGKVNGVRGEAVMQLNVEEPATGGIFGEWAIMSGTGGLRHLRGAGTWVYTHSSADEVYGFADYTGAVWSTSKAKCPDELSARARMGRLSWRR
jgi:hypothetical protein